MNEVKFDSLKNSNHIGMGTIVKKIHSTPDVFAYYKYLGMGENFILKYGLAISNHLTTDLDYLKWSFNKIPTTKFFITEGKLLTKSKAPFKGLSYPMELMKESDKGKAVQILEYSPLSYIVLGDTRNINGVLKKNGCIFCTKLKHPTTKDIISGWVFSRSKKLKIEHELGININ